MKALICSSFLSFLCFGGYYPLDSLENTDLFLAIAQGDFVTAETVLEEEIDLLDENRSVHEATAFHALAITDDEKGSVDFLPKLIEYGGDINAPDFYGITGLMHALREHRYQLAQAFLQNEQIDIYRENNKGENILHIFAKTDLTNPDAIQALDMVLSQDITNMINGESVFNQYPIHHAIYKGNIELVKILVDRPEMDINVADTYGNVPLLLALKRIFEILDRDRNKRSYFQKIFKESQIVQIILSSAHDVDLTIKSAKGQSPGAELRALKEYLLELSEDSFYYQAFEPIRDILFLDKSLVYHH